MNAVTSDARLPLAVLISGGGTTLRNLIEQIKAGRLHAEIRTVIASTASAGGLQFAHAARIPAHVVPWSEYTNNADFSREVFRLCREAGAELVVLAGFLKLLDIPADFQGRVMNIHPALIPSFCGQGFYGQRVHQAVLEHGVKITGCTVHFVDNQYDHGPIILQRAVPVQEDDTPQTLAARVFEAECQAYPEAIGLYAAGRLKIEGRRVRVLPQG